MCRAFEANVSSASSFRFIFMRDPEVAFVYIIKRTIDARVVRGEI